jgi:hypothetical protein
MIKGIWADQPFFGFSRPAQMPFGAEIGSLDNFYRAFIVY